ncbi:4Fe-4S ferredoxin [Butyricicoccus faecihominis]|uniref:4Fe-4S ferredoxin n=1 Tax=Butyricicoccaceae TaxID=3085642 RepID=UPI002479EB58|nr:MULTISPECIES: 4Fe-4S ferredoxin [Butyricicoccaceae]MCQ5128103.1 4Fe-4S ferredoxin [Butyricicoccus faecihominis]WNX86408.1 4Fe-4S ferredoxin [Agathobaculum sp. NTUH-O15-33]
MTGTLESTGIASREMFEKLLPSAERRAKGPYAVMECYEEIPCNPCSTSCPCHAVKMGSLNECPICEYDDCTGCGSCVSRCPGLACFVINETVGNGLIDITFPYEMLPVPEKGAIVQALGRDGAVVGQAEIVRVLHSPKLDHTNVITMRVAAELIYDARNIRCE